MELILDEELILFIIENSHYNSTAGITSNYGPELYPEKAQLCGYYSDEETQINYILLKGNFFDEDRVHYVEFGIDPKVFELKRWMRKIYAGHYKLWKSKDYPTPLYSHHENILAQDTHG